MSIFNGTWLEGSWVDDGLSWGFDKLDDIGESVGNTIGGVLNGATDWFNNNTDSVMGSLVNKWTGNDKEQNQVKPNITSSNGQHNTILWIGGGIALVVVIVLFMTMKKK